MHEETVVLNRKWLTYGQASEDKKKYVTTEQGTIKKTNLAVLNESWA
jgi:hypothetical protein